jgi:putative flippase GtrA
MPPPVTRPAELAATGTWHALGRHQLGAVAATAVDFATMIVGVQWIGLSPVAGTAAGATLGAATNFALGRGWVFSRQSQHVAVQGARYGLVSAASAGLTCSTWSRGCSLRSQ